LDVKQEGDYGVHASCLKAHHDAIVKQSKA
jgi:hypothetical protein